MDYIKGEIILIDDEEYELSFIKLSVKELGYDISIKYFRHPREALEYLERSSKAPFLIISDYNMPEMSGLELKKSIDQNVELRKKESPVRFLLYSCNKRSN
jgi:CheY-like chemotaxis protein